MPASWREFSWLRIGLPVRMSGPDRAGPGASGADQDRHRRGSGPRQTARHEQRQRAEDAKTKREAIANLKLTLPKRQQVTDSRARSPAATIWRSCRLERGPDRPKRHDLSSTGATGPATRTTATHGTVKGPDSGDPSATEKADSEQELQEEPVFPARSAGTKRQDAAYQGP